jgi:hypothetical protein
MAVTLTTETITGTSGETETIIVAREVINNGAGDDDLEIAIAIDNTSYLDRIATSLESIANSLNVGVTENLAAKISNIESHLNAFEDTVELILDSAPAFNLHENITGGATGRVVYQNGNRLVIANASGNYTGTITGSVSTASAVIEDYNLTNNLGSDVKQYTRQADAIRVFLAIPSASKESSRVTFDYYDNRTIRDNRFEINVEDVSLSEGDTLSVRIGTPRERWRDPNFKVWIVDSLEYFKDDVNADPSRIAVPNSKGVMTNNGSSYGQTITWKIPYGTKESYYIYVDGSKKASGKIAISTNPWIQDEKVTGSIKGEGYVMNYNATSSLGFRAIDIYDIHHEFEIGETISGSKSGNSGTILDIIHYNQIKGSAGGANDLALGALYKTFIEEGYAADISNNVSSREQSLAIERYRAAISGAKGI